MEVLQALEAEAVVRPGGIRRVEAVPFASGIRVRVRVLEPQPVATRTSTVARDHERRSRFEETLAKVRDAEPDPDDRLPYTAFLWPR